MRAQRVLWIGLTVILASCSLFKDQNPPVFTPAEAKKLTVDVVARDNRCTPNVIAADRGGGALLITFRVSSDGRDHYFVFPAANIRRTVRKGETVEIPFTAVYSGVYDIACTSFRWVGPFAHTSKLAIK